MNGNNWVWTRRPRQGRSKEADLKCNDRQCQYVYVLLIFTPYVTACFDIDVYSACDSCIIVIIRVWYKVLSYGVLHSNLKYLCIYGTYQLVYNMVHICYARLIICYAVHHMVCNIQSYGMLHTIWEISKRYQTVWFGIVSFCCLVLVICAFALVVRIFHYIWPLNETMACLWALIKAVVRLLYLVFSLFLLFSVFSYSVLIQVHAHSSAHQYVAQTGCTCNNCVCDSNWIVMHPPSSLPAVMSVAVVVVHCRQHLVRNCYLYISAVAVKLSTVWLVDLQCLCAQLLTMFLVLLMLFSEGKCPRRLYLVLLLCWLAVGIGAVWVFVGG